MFRNWRCFDVVLVVTVRLLAIRATNSTNPAMSCFDASMKCAFRTGCGAALQQFNRACASLLHGDDEECPEVCQHALIALTSTDEGKELMTCSCPDDGDLLCRQSKERVEICRSSVTRAMNNTRVSCRIATQICNADVLCSTALAYYNEYCRSMFHGKKCTHRCRNSINILRRQEKAAKLNTCICDGAESYDCKGIHRNMDVLCFGKSPSPSVSTTEVVGDTNTNEILRAVGRAEGIGVTVRGTTVALIVASLLFVR